MWTVGLTGEIKLCFRDGLVWTVGLTGERKLRFRDGLVWTVGLTGEIKLRFRDGYIVYVIESAAYGVLFTSCLCPKPERARYERVRAFDTNNE